MVSTKRLLVILLSIVLVPLLPTTSGADSVVIDRFNGDLATATLDFNHSVVNSSLSIDVPPGATLTEASMVVEGVGVNGSPSSALDFYNGVLWTNVYAYWNQGLKLYPPNVDPRRHQWTQIGNAEVTAIAKLDDSSWVTQSAGQGLPPYEYPLQLYRFIPNSAGATTMNVTWHGYGTNALNLTIPFWADMWLYDHTNAKWVRVGNYSSTSSSTDPFQWLNYSFTLPSPYVDTDGSIDVVMAGPHTESNLVVNSGQLFTDYIAIDVVSVGQLQYPKDVVLNIDGVQILTMPDNVTVPRVIDDAYGFMGGLQQVLDAYPVTPDNVTLTFEFSLPAPTAGNLMVRDLLIRYTPVVNEAPTYSGPSTVHINEDAGRMAVLDLDTAFDDDFNRGTLDFQVVGVDDSQFPRAILAGISTPPGENTSLFITPDLNFYGGPVNVTLSATDAFESIITVTVSVIVDPVGDRPELESGGSFEAFERSPFSHVFTVTDVDLPDDSFTFSDSSDMFDIDPQTGALNWTPASNQIGEHRFSITVTDSYGLIDSQTYTINVKNSNDPPVITSDLTIDATQDQEVVYDITANDPDVPFGDVLTFAAYTDGVGLDVDSSTGRVIFTPANAQVPSFEITLRVQDILGVTDEQVLVVSVENVNDPPVLADVTSLTFNQGQEVRYQLEVYDPDMDVELTVPETLTFSTAGPDQFEPDAAGVVSFTPDQTMVGTHQVTYTVRDAAGLQDAVTITWTIVDVNDAPVITTQLPDDVEEDAPVNMTMAANDLDGDTVTWSDDTDLFDIDPATGQFEFIPTQDDVGNQLITITADDGHGGVSMRTWDFMVVNVNDDPVVGEVTPKSGTTYSGGKAITFSAQATDEDGDSLTFTWMRGNKLLGTGRELEVKDLAPGKHTITLVVDDGNGGEATQDVKVEVTPAGLSVLSIAVGLLVVVLVVVIGAVLFARSRTAAKMPPEPVEEEEEVVEKVTFSEAKVLEYETEGLAHRREGGTDSVDEPIYDLEKAEEFRVSDKGDDLPEGPAGPEDVVEPEE